MKLSNSKMVATYFLLPVSLFLLLFLILPLISNVYISFFNIQNNPKEWFDYGMSFENYRQLVMQNDFINATKNSIIYSVFATIGITVIGFAAAVAINGNFKGKKLAIWLIMLSWVVPSYVIGMQWGNLLQPSGLVNYLLFDVLNADRITAVFGAEWNYDEFGDLIKPRWLNGENAIVVIALSAIWHYWPYSMLLFMAGLNSIRPEIYYTAMLDGARKWEIFVYVTLPILRPVIIGVLIQNIIINIYSFNLIIMAFGNGTITPSSYADTLMTYIFRTSFNTWNFGVGSALSTLLMFTVGFVILAYYWRISDGDNYAEN